MKRLIPFSIFLIGFTAMTAQIIFMREFLIVFYGNELSIGFILASWLMGGAIGSYILGRFSDRISLRPRAFSLCQLIISFILPLDIIAIRLIRLALGMNPGEIAAFFPILASSFVVLAPICIILGFMFSMGCRIYESEAKGGAKTIGRVYLIESIGAMAGGAIVSFVLIQLFNSMSIAAFLSLLNALTALLLTFKEKRKYLLSAAAGIVFMSIVAIWAFNGWRYLDEYSLKKEWKGYDLVVSKNSIYGNVAVTKSGGEISFFDNGLHLYTVPDKLTSEEATHYALLEHPDPKRVLLIGGGAGGLMEEVLKHPTAKVDYVELDPLIVKMALQYLDKNSRAPLRDKRVTIINTDGRFFVKAAKERYDCVIIDLGDPYTAQLNRYYTLEFFKEAARILKGGGVISFGVTSSENYISKELNDFLSSIYATLKKVFPSVVIMPGDTAYFLASNEKDLLTYDYHIMMERARKRGLDLKYVREYYLFSKLSAQRISYMEDAVKKGGGIKINRDLRPISYYYDIVFWSSRFRDSLFSKILKSATGKRVWGIAIIFYISLLLFGGAARRRKDPVKSIVLLAVLGAGFTGLAFQVLVMISFQIIYGYLFYKLGIILTFFMAGLAAGSLTAIRALSKLKNGRLAFIITQYAICAYPLILPVFLWTTLNSKSALVSWLGSNVLFLILPAMAGFVGGFQFPLANKLYLAGEEGIGKAAGLTYGVDLFGSCIGAILTGAILIPILGIPQTCLAISLMNLAVLAGLL